MGRTGTGGLAEMITDPGPFLRRVAEAGVTMSAFQGAVA
jgi:hypothetical protein